MRKRILRGENVSFVSFVVFFFIELYSTQIYLSDIQHFSHTIFFNIFIFTCIFGSLDGINIWISANYIIHKWMSRLSHVSHHKSIYISRRGAITSTKGIY